MYPQPDQPAFGTFVQDQVEAICRQGVEVDVLFINGRKSRWNYVWGLFRLWRQVLRKRYDVVHAHYLFSGIIARLQPFIPVAVTYHGSELGVSRQHWLSRLACAAAPFFHRVIVVSPQMKQRLDGSNVCVIPCGINLDEIKPVPLPQARQQLGLPADKPLVLWAADPRRPEKRYSLVEQAMKLVKQSLPNAELVLVADQPHQVIPIYMSACDVLALTSTHEGSPMVIKEAMACNLPIVSVDVGDVVAVIGETEHCYLVEPTPEAVAEKLYVALSNRRRTDGRSKVGRLESNHIASRIIEVYKEICKA
jgi:glycosyltransferase involved in cell wall biosynthesis